MKVLATSGRDLDSKKTINLGDFMPTSAVLSKSAPCTHFAGKRVFPPATASMAGFVGSL